MELSFPVTIDSVLGQRWHETVFPFDTVGELKTQLWRRTGIETHRQALVFCGRELSRDSAALSDFGIRAGSSIRLVVVARSGPSSSYTQEMSRVDSALSENERWRRGCSATEDTSAKESSAGETEHDEESNQRRLAKLAEACSSGRHPRRQRTVSTNQNGKADGTSQDPLSTTTDLTSEDNQLLWVPQRGENGRRRESVDEEETQADGGYREEVEGTSTEQAQNPDLSTEECVNASDPSELSSGMIVCDLSNEFRKLKVRRRHHPSTVPNGIRVNRARSKPRGLREGPSSSDEGGCDRVGEEEETQTVGRLQISLPARRVLPPNRGRPIGLRNSAQLRCSVCAFKLTNTFNCRCGKSLCSRHRSAQAHTCTRGRKAQQVSD